MAQPCPTKLCPTCTKLVKQIPDDAVAIPLPEDLLEGIVSKNEKKKAEQSSYFYKCMNALLNNGTGTAVLHTKSPHLFGKFNEIVDNRLLDLISDNSCFADNFDVSFHDDNHVMFRIKPIARRPLSILSFKTKLSVDKGLADPTHGQFRQLLHRCTGTSSPKDAESSSAGRQNQKRKRKLDTRQEKARFEETIAIHGTDKADVTNPIDFHEVVGIEAKSLIKLPPVPSSKDKTEVLFKYIWEVLFLPRYLTAFSKLSAGGSIFYGIRQDKKIGESKKWCRMEEGAAEDVFELRDNSYVVWKSKLTKKTFLVAAELDFKQETHPEEDMGTFSYEKKLSLDEREQKSLRRKIIEAAQTRLMWHPAYPPKDPVRVEFHRITQQRPFYYVVEVAVEHFPGFVFMDTDGPEVYRLNKDHKPERFPGKPAALLQRIQKQFFRQEEQAKNPSEKKEG